MFSIIIFVSIYDLHFVSSNLKHVFFSNAELILFLCFSVVIFIFQNSLIGMKTCILNIGSKNGSLNLVTIK